MILTVNRCANIFAQNTNKRTDRLHRNNYNFWKLCLDAMKVGYKFLHTQMGKVSGIKMISQKCQLTYCK